MATLTFPLSSLSVSAQPKPDFRTNSKTLVHLPSPKGSSFSNPFNLKTLNPILSQSPAPLRLSNTHSDLIASDNSPSRSLKSRLHNGETLYGLFLLTFSPTLAEIAGLAGYDFVVVDMEHGHGGVSDALPCLHALAATRTPAILRVPESCPTWAKKALDLGPQGIMFPMIDSGKLAKKAVSYCRFPPAGVRGSAHTSVRASSYGMEAGYLSNHEEEFLIMCQVESVEGVKNIEDIAAVDGVDCIQMGPTDLSATMGYLWDPGNKKVREMMKIAEKGVLGRKKNPREGGAFLAGFAMPHDSPDDIRSRGYHMVSGAADVGLFSYAALEDVKKFKMGLKKASDDEKEDAKGDDEKYWSE